ncbi:MAG TPA: prolyl oligopeptidase family serine peptidase [Bryobacteraceae bacterium]|nr:prolyl oligopeptidase family serine peptidase [Bryobacteraceae bacterium]
MKSAFIGFLSAAALSIAQPPKTAVKPVTETIDGVTITDPYRWLEDQNSPETRAWIKSQMAYTEAELGKVRRRQHIRQLLSGLFKVDAMTPPIERGGRYFFRRRSATEDQAVLYYRQGESGKDIVLVDPNPLSPDHSTSVQLMDASNDGRVIAYGLRKGGQDEVSVHFRMVDSGSDLADVFPAARYESAQITHDRKGVYYEAATAQGPRIFYHAMGTPVASDKMIFGRQYDATHEGDCFISSNGRWLVCEFLTGSAGDKVELYVQDLASGGGMKPVVTGIDARFEAQVAGDRMYVLTNWKAPNSRILTIDLTHPARDSWEEIVGERPYVLENFSLAGGKLAANWLEDVHSHIEILTAEGKLVRQLQLPGIGEAGPPRGRWESDVAFYSYSSLNRPPTIYRYNMASGAQSVWFQQKEPFDPATVEVKQVWYSSKDGTRVPMFLAYPKGIKLDGSHPALLTGYGGFNVNMLPAASSTALAWLEMGGVFALPNLRGGGEFGEKWHDAGKLDKKQNVFDDFIAAAEYLIREGYTSKQRLAISGRSNGGLLVGAALTQRPDLFRAVICGFPLLDMVRYDRFKVAKFWIPEYGTAQNPNQFPFIYKYSPYQHVEKGVKYPAVLLVSGDFDTRVDPLHARKMAALLQASSASGRPVLLRYDTESGHSAGVPLDKQIGESTDEMSFLAWQLGMKPALK